MKKSTVDTELLNLMVRLCHLIAFETEARTGKSLSLPHGMDQEKLNLDDADKETIIDKLYALTDQGTTSREIASLAESFGLMLVKIDVHQMKLDRLINELKKKNKALELAKQRLGEQNRSLMGSLREKYSPARFVGQCPEMQKVKELALNIANRPINTLILGASGTGKEVFAKIIHFNSPRADKPFVAINCTAIAETLFESEMFGIEKGVATGVSKRTGFFEQAHTGTIFLDEIGDMSLSNQAKLLRVLEEREVMRVGGTKPVKIDVKIITATNADVKKAVEQGKFREDLYYRLNVVELCLPPLKERQEDIIILAEKLLAKNCADLGRTPIFLSDRARKCLAAYDWPGNVRELNNEMERAAALALTDRVEVSDLSEKVSRLHRKDKGGAVPEKKDGMLDLTGGLTLADAEKTIVQTALARCKNNKTRAAAMLGITREGLRKKMIRWEESPEN
ncbi:sigma-54 interaction domain-containing protein [Desulfospira joergensenii]|uniref:sigma-54 interaction domain-containing protein n=1 Tax=Desulfospira joergensenii TaxID=53329 RepID=UPI0003B4F9F6|nr:sigma-54 dependent transcriptional regulator [Desulfospira joergensenii]